MVTRVVVLAIVSVSTTVAGAEPLRDGASGSASSLPRGGRATPHGPSDDLGPEGACWPRLLPDPGAGTPPPPGYRRRTRGGRTLLYVGMALVGVTYGATAVWGALTAVEAETDDERFVGSAYLIPLAGPVVAVARDGDEARLAVPFLLAQGASIGTLVAGLLAPPTSFLVRTYDPGAEVSWRPVPTLLGPRTGGMGLEVTW
ncbi:MAG: hypothetical protein AAGN82_00160 [Myxococcota bacterium]